MSEEFWANIKIWLTLLQSLNETKDELKKPILRQILKIRDLNPQVLSIYSFSPDRLSICDFCGVPAVEYNEHYVACLDCRVVYTDLYKLEKGCTHVSDSTLTIISGKSTTTNPVLDRDGTCSVCGAYSLADGW